MPARCIHGNAGHNTDDAGDNTDDPGLKSGMLRGAIRECVKALKAFPDTILRSSVAQIKRNLKKEVGIDSKLLNQIQ